MKLRLQANSIRLRLKRSEVEQLVKTGNVAESIVFGSGEGQSLCYGLEMSLKISAVQALRDGTCIVVQVPAEIAFRWARTDEVGIEATQSTGSEDLKILIEKDFACLNDTEEQNADKFPHPRAGTKC